MKNLWKYLSSLGLMFVAFLCLGVGLKSNERAQAAKDYDVYVTGGAKYNMSGTNIGSINSVYIGSNSSFMMSGSSGSINTITMSGNSQFNVGTSANLSIGSITGSSGSTIYLDGGTIEYVRTDGTCNMGYSSCRAKEIYLGQGATFKYTMGRIDKITNYIGTIWFTAQPSNVVEINAYHSAVGDKIAQVETADFDLSNIKVTNLTSGTKLKVQQIDGKYWIVVTDMVSVTFKVNNANYGSFTRNGRDYVTSATYEVKAGTTILDHSCEEGTSVKNLMMLSSAGSTILTIYPGPQNGYMMYLYQYDSGVIDKDMTITLIFISSSSEMITLQFSSGGGGYSLSRTTALSMPKGTTMTISSSGTSTSATFTSSAYGYSYKRVVTATQTDSKYSFQGVWYNVTNGTNYYKGNNYTISAGMTIAPLYRNLSFTANEEESDSRSYDVAYDDFPILINSMLGRATLQFVAGCLCV